MKKKFKQALLLSFLISLSLGKASNAQELDIFVNRAKINMDSKPYISQTQRTMVPVSFISNALNLKTTWRENSQSVLIEKDKKEIVIPIGSTHAFINGKPVDMDSGRGTAAEIKNSRTMVPISFIATSFGLDVSFIEGRNGLNHSIFISGEKKTEIEKEEIEKEKEIEIEKEKEEEEKEIIEKKRIEIENKRKVEETLISSSKKTELIKNVSGMYPDSKEIQEAIESHLENKIYKFELNLRSFNLSSGGGKSPFDLFNEVFNDSMTNIIEYDWRYVKTSLKYSQTSARLEVEITMSMTEEEERFVDEWVSKKIREFSSDKKGMELEREKLKYVTDLLAREIEYDQSMTKSTEYMGLTGGTTTCNGYARLSKRFFDGFGIENALIVGDANGPHIWNKVKYDGRWLHIDNTWNDPIINQNIGKDKNHVIYDFFLKDDAFMSRTHDF